MADHLIDELGGGHGPHHPDLMRPNPVTPTAPRSTPNQLWRIPRLLQLLPWPFRFVRQGSAEVPGAVHTTEVRPFIGQGVEAHIHQRQYKERQEGIHEENLEIGTWFSCAVVPGFGA